MPHVNAKEPRIMEALIEKAFRAIGFVLVHDGCKPNEAVQYQNSEQDKPGYFTRVYRWQPEGEPSRVTVKFHYDLRTNLCDFAISLQNLDEYCALLKGTNNRPKQNFDRMKEVVNGQVSKKG